MDLYKTFSRKKTEKKNLKKTLLVCISRALSSFRLRSNTRKWRKSAKALALFQNPCPNAQVPKREGRQALFFVLHRLPVQVFALAFWISSCNEVFIYQCFNFITSELICQPYCCSFLNLFILIP